MSRFLEGFKEFYYWVLFDLPVKVIRLIYNRSVFKGKQQSIIRQVQKEEDLPASYVEARNTAAASQGTTLTRSRTIRVREDYIPGPRSTYGSWSMLSMATYTEHYPHQVWTQDKRIARFEKEPEPKPLATPFSTGSVLLEDPDILRAKARLERLSRILGQPAQFFKKGGYVELGIKPYSRILTVVSEFDKIMEKPAIRKKLAILVIGACDAIEKEDNINQLFSRMEEEERENAEQDRPQETGSGLILSGDAGGADSRSGRFLGPGNGDLADDVSSSDTGSGR